MLTRSRAAQGDHRIGDRISLTVGDGEARRLRVAGLIPDRVVPAEVVLSRATVRAAVLIGALLGAASAALAQCGSVAGLRAQTGLPITVAVPWPVPAATIGACLALAVLTSLMPAVRRRFAT